MTDDASTIYYTPWDGRTIVMPNGRTIRFTPRTQAVRVSTNRAHEQVETMKEGLQLFCFDCSHCYDCIQRLGKSCADRSGLHQYKRTLDGQCFVCSGPNELAGRCQR